MTNDVNCHWAITTGPTAPQFRHGRGFVSAKNVIDSSTMREEKELQLQREALKIVRVFLTATHGGPR